MGRPGTGERLASSRSISQFLADAPAAPVSGGLVRPGWYAVNDCNARVFDGPGSDWDNPFSQQGRLDDNSLFTGAAPGLAPRDQISGFTV